MGIKFGTVGQKTDTTSVLSPTLDNLIELHHRRRRGLTLLQAFDTTEDRWATTEEIVKQIDSDYRVALAAFRNASDPDELTQRREKGSTILARLWEADDPRFEDALARYEVLCDVQLSADVLYQHMESELRILRTGRSYAVRSRKTPEARATDVARRGGGR